jgi:hypothetical protein
MTLEICTEYISCDFLFSCSKDADDVCFVFSSTYSGPFCSTAFANLSTGLLTSTDSPETIAFFDLPSWLELQADLCAHAIGFFGVKDHLLLELIGPNRIRRRFVQRSYLLRERCDVF